MEQLKEQLNELRDRLEKIKGSLNVDEKEKELRELEAKSLKEDFWSDNENARRVMREIDNLRSDIESVANVEQEIEDTFSVVGEETLRAEVEQALAKISKTIQKLEVATFLSGSFDKSDSILSIHAGQGGTEAMDWTQMLFRMYSRFAERRDWSAEVIEQVPGEEAGLKSVTLLISGPYAYGNLKGEAGTHRPG